MTANAVATGYSKESPTDRIYNKIGETLLGIVQRQPEAWSHDDRKTAIACIRHLVYGTESPASQRHTVNGTRYIHLTEPQSSLLQCLHLEALWDEELV